MVNTDQIKHRGNTLHFNEIDKKDRYLISEMACKTFANINSEKGLLEKLIASYEEAYRRGIKRPTYRSLLDGTYSPSSQEELQMSLFTTTDIISTKLFNINGTHPTVIPDIIVVIFFLFTPLNKYVATEKAPI